MVETLYLVRRADRSRRAQLVDGIHTVLLTTTTVGADYIAAEAVDACRLAGHDIPDGYFDTVEFLGDPLGGPLADDGDAYVLLGDCIQKVEGS